MQYSFLSVAIFWTASETMAPSHNNRKWQKIFSKSFSQSNSSRKSLFFAVLMYVLYRHPRYFKFRRKFQQYDPCFQIIFPFLMTMNILKKGVVKQVKTCALLIFSPSLDTNKRKAIYTTMVKSQLNYCPLIWIFCPRRSNNLINKVQKRALRITYNDRLTDF